MWYSGDGSTGMVMVTGDGSAGMVMVTGDGRAGMVIVTDAGGTGVEQAMLLSSVSGTPGCWELVGCVSPAWEAGWSPG